MSFLTPGYGLFLVIVFIVYWSCPGRFRYLVLLGASCWFYACGGAVFLVLLLGITVAAWFFSKYVRGRWSYLLLLLPLLYFKYFGFILDTFGISGIKAENIALPLGISFYTFSALGYVIDCRNERCRPFDSFLQLASGICFFPCLISGPIERQHELVPQITAEKSFDYDMATEGLKIMAWGYFKKLVIAGTLSLTTDEVFSKLHEYTGWPLVMAAVMFSVQIYCDFSGYSDIAIGTAQLFGIRLVKNFDAPYMAGSIKEFWGRWHISLSHWFRDYVYIPLGGNRKGSFRHSLNLIITFLVSGLWHGAGWNYVIWGGIHGGLQVIENGVSALTFGKAAGSGKKEGDNRVIRAAKICFNFIMVTAAWVFFKTEKVEDAFYLFSNMFKAAPVLVEENNVVELFDRMNISTVSDYATIIVSFVLLILYDQLNSRENIWKRISRFKKPARWAVYLALGLFTILLKPEESVGQFIYFKF